MGHYFIQNEKALICTALVYWSMQPIAR